MTGIGVRVFNCINITQAHMEYEGCIMGWHNERTKMISIPPYFNLRSKYLTLKVLLTLHLATVQHGNFYKFKILL